MKWQIPYGGRTWELDDSRITASEARLQKRLTGGLSPVAADAARTELDPDAWFAGLAIARKRTGLAIEEAVAIDDEQLNLGDILDTTTAAYAAEAKAAKDKAENDTAPGEEQSVDEPATEAAPAA